MKTNQHIIDSKYKLYSLIERLKVVLFVTLAFFSLESKSEPCPSLKISGQSVFCGPGGLSGSSIFEGTYTLDFYNKSSAQVWFIEGGTIVDVDLESYNKYENVSTPGNPTSCISCTTYVYTGSDKIEDDIVTAECKSGEGCSWEVNPVALADYLEADNSGLLTPPKLKIRWNSAATVHRITVYAAGLGVLAFCGEMNASMTIDFKNSVSSSSWNLASSNSSPTCDQGISISGTPNSDGFSTSWGWDSGVNIGSTWQTGLYVNNFNSIGSNKIWANVTDACGTTTYHEISINSQSKTAGPLIDNTGQSSINSIIPDANGNYQLRLSNYINGANYQWLTPNLYSPTNGFTNKITNTNQNSIISKFPSNALQDYTGKVVKSGVCGVEEFPYTIKALVTPSIPTQIVSCDKTVPIFFNNPTFLSIYSSWVQSGPSGAYVQNINHQQVNLVATQNGVYNVCFSIQNLSQQPCTKVTVGKYPDRAQTPVNADWQAGTLSELPKDVASNLSATGNEGFEQIYFTDKSGKLWYYQFTNGINKWVPNQVDISSSPASLIVNPLTKSLIVHPIWPIVFYTNINGGISRVSSFYGFPAQPTVGTDQVSGKLIFSSDSYSGNGYFRNANGSINIFNIWNNQSNLFANINCANEELYTNGGFIYYVNSANNKIFRLSEANPNVRSQVVSKSDFPTIRTSTNIRVIGNNIYFVASNGRIVEANMTSDSWTYITSQILTIGGPVPNFNGPFDINASTGVIYSKGSLSGLRGSVIPNQIAQIYKDVNSAWQIKVPGGSISNFPQFYVSNSLLFYFKHLYYISTTGKGILNATDNNINSVWNLYLNTECIPAIFRQEDNQSSSDIVSSNTLLSPNPFNNTLNIQLDQIGENRVELYNFLGVKMIESTSYGSYLGIATEGFPVGSYLAKIYQNGLLITSGKVIKE